MAHSPIIDSSDGVWIIYSGWSNRMSGTKSLFRNIDESKKSESRFDDDKQVRVEGKGTIAIKTM